MLPPRTHTRKQSSFDFYTKHHHVVPLGGVLCICARDTGLEPPHNKFSVTDTRLELVTSTMSM